MIVLTLRNGAVFSQIGRVGKDAFRIPSEAFDFEKNFSAKSNEAGSEEIGQRRLESNTIVLRGEWVATSDFEYSQILNPLVTAFHETLYITDTESNRRLKVVPLNFEISHDNGCFRRSGDFSASFQRISPAWEDVVESAASFTVPGGGASYDTVNFGYSEVRSRMEIIPTGGTISLVDIISLIPGVNGYQDRIVGVLSLLREDAVLCPTDRGIVVDNVNGLCYTSPLVSPYVSGSYVTDQDRLDIRQYIKPGTSFFRHGSGENGLSITTNNNTTVRITWNNRLIT